MASPKRTKMRIENDRCQTAKLYIRGQTQQEIAGVIGVSRQQIAYDLKVIKAQWRAETAHDLDAHRARQLAELVMVAGEAWAGWERSILGERPGSPSYLEIVLRCSERKAKLLGLDAPIKADVNVQTGLASLSKLVYERKLAEGGVVEAPQPPLRNGSRPSL